MKKNNRDHDTGMKFSVDWERVKLKESISSEPEQNVISRVIPGSIADRMGVLQGDRLLMINHQPIMDVIDYRFYMSEEHLEVLIRKPDDSEWVLDIEKEYDDELGIEFENPVMAKTRVCRNQCIFCFIDQMPAEMRESLYVKDDDSRLSFLQGNYITLTNMSESELDKLIRYRISPLNISVHTTNPELRIKMLKNTRAGTILQHMQRFHSNQMKMNIQIVLCPGWNDGEELDRTLSDLESMTDSITSVAIVPVGLTKYQQNKDVQPVTNSIAMRLIRQIEGWQQYFSHKTGRKLIYPSDELYIKAGLPWPKASEYDAFYQLENGVGMLASFEKDAVDYLKKIPVIRKSPYHLTIATGVAAAPFMRAMSKLVSERILGVTIQVAVIENDFFGHQIDVSGLITGKDLVCSLKEYPLGDGLIIPRNMLKNDENIFLDDMTPEQVKEALNVPVQPCSVDGKLWIKEMLRFTSRNKRTRSENQHVKSNCSCHRKT